MSLIRLSPQQIHQFNTFGFLALPGLLADRAEQIIAAFEQVWVDGGGGHGGKVHDGKARSVIVPFIDQSVYLSSLLDDPHIEGIGASLLGDDFNYMGSDGNYYVGDTGWHSDGWHQELAFLKIAFYLDPLTKDTGALRVIPGTHQPGNGFADVIQKEIYKSSDLWGISGRDIPAVPLETKPGDVLVFHHNTKHASFGGGKARRMFTMNLSQHIPEAGIPTLKKYIAGHDRFWLDSMYGKAMIETAGPRRRVHLEQVLANESHLPALSAKAKKEMTELARS